VRAAALAGVALAKRAQASDVSSRSTHDRPGRRLRSVNSPRVRRALRLVDELELGPEETRELAAELTQRPACVVDWDKVASDDRELVELIERRLNNPTGPMISMTDANRMVRERLAELRAARRPRRTER